jgi:rhodanese-related sulfurtransferase
MQAITMPELKQLLQADPTVKVIDVRSPEEFQTGSIPGAINIPTNHVMAQKQQFQSDQPVYIVCQSGTRSKLVVLTLQAQGIQNLVNVTGGMNAWSI